MTLSSRGAFVASPVTVGGGAILVISGLLPWVRYVGVPGVSYPAYGVCAPFASCLGYPGPPFLLVISLGAMVAGAGLVHFKRFHWARPLAILLLNSEATVVIRNLHSTMHALAVPAVDQPGYYLAVAGLALAWAGFALLLAEELGHRSARQQVRGQHDRG